MVAAAGNPWPIIALPARVGPTLTAGGMNPKRTAYTPQPGPPLLSDIEVQAVKRARKFSLKLASMVATTGTY